jgi:hypothetical protein
MNFLRQRDVRSCHLRSIGCMPFFFAEQGREAEYLIPAVENSAGTLHAHAKKSETKFLYPKYKL